MNGVKRVRTVLAVAAVMLAMVLVSVVTAAAQGGNTGNLQSGQGAGGTIVEQGFEQEAESGDVDAEFSSANAGDNSNVCAPALGFGNTGNVQNEQGVPQLSPLDEIEFSAEEQMVFEPSLETECEQAVQQASAASSS